MKITKRKLVKIIREAFNYPHDHQGRKEDDEIILALDTSLRHLENAIQLLSQESEHYYANSDNMRGNVRNDSSGKLEEVKTRMKIIRDYTTAALKK